MIISRTPFRVSFFGGGTDFLEFYREHGGAVLLTTIDKFCYLSLHALSPFFKHRFRASYATTESVLHPSEFKHPLIRETLLQLNVQQGLELSHVADLPGRTGLGSSSAFTVGLLHALHVFQGNRITAEDLAREAIVIERERVGDSGGHQDQYAAAYGGLIRLDFGAGDRVTVRRLAVSSSRVAELERHLLLFYTGTEQSAERILCEQKQRTKQNKTALLELLGMVNESEKIVTNETDITLFGKLLHDAWQLKKGLSSGISNDIVNQAYEAARRAGAIGGKLLGAGGRGFLLVFAPPETHPAIRTSLSTLQEVRFSFCDRGSEIIFNTNPL
jgi:D-glycero-alpha-D-manno-heptose-7-phosphate kinase